LRSFSDGLPLRHPRAACDLVWTGRFRGRASLSFWTHGPSSQTGGHHPDDGGVDLATSVTVIYETSCREIA
jgi:hypothetical protein